MATIRRISGSIIRRKTQVGGPLNYAIIKDRVAVICANAVDVKVYDTELDSDGGVAVQAMSPAQVAIDAEATNVKVYDATNPTLPLWRTYDLTGYTVNAVAVLNGILCIATTTGLMVLDYINDGVAIGLTHTTATSPAIVNNVCNDLTMTVLAGAAIDPATGLPTPTTGVGTDGDGTYLASIIQNDGNVYDVAADVSATCTSISISSDGELIVVSSTGTIYIWDDVGAIAADGASPDATITDALGTVSISEAA